MRRPFVIGNWKMNQLLPDVQLFFQSFAFDLVTEDIEVGIAPTHVHLSQAVSLCQGTPLQIGAQDCHSEKLGAHTGDISATMVQDVGAQFVIVGHSERRHNHGEPSALVAAKARAAIESKLIPVICVGESLEEREADQTSEVISKQLTESLQGIDAGNVVIAYEPVWAIGTGKTASSTQAQEIHELIRNLFSQLFNEDEAQKLRILYGGSVKPGNSEELIAAKDIDGFLVGGASLETKSFEGIITALKKQQSGA